MTINLTAKFSVGNYPLRPPLLITTTPRERIDRLLLSVAEKHGLTVADLRGKQRTKKIATARQQAMWELKRFGLSLPRIGRILNRHHTTVLYGVRQHAKRADLQRWTSLGNSVGIASGNVQISSPLT